MCVVIGVVCCSDKPVEKRGAQKPLEISPEICGSCQENPESSTAREGTTSGTVFVCLAIGMHCAVIRVR